MGRITAFIGKGGMMADRNVKRLIYISVFIGIIFVLIMAGCRKTSTENTMSEKVSSTADQATDMPETTADTLTDQTDASADSDLDQPASPSKPELAERVDPEAAQRLSVDTEPELTEIVNDRQEVPKNNENLETVPLFDLSQFKGILTFDDGPHPRTTPQIIEVLKSAGIKNAIFFFLGYRMMEYPHLVRQTYEAGFEIGYHSMYHQDLVHLKPEQIAEDIDRFKKALNSALELDREYPLRIGRPPFGGMTSKTVKTFLKMEKDGSLATAGLNPKFNRRFVKNAIIRAFLDNKWKCLLWNIDFDDWQQPVDLKHLDNTYVPGREQVLLFHEMPIYSSNMKMYDNGIEKMLPDVLMRISELDAPALSGN